MKLQGQLNRNLLGTIFGRSSITITHFVAIRNQTWPPQAISFLISSFLKKSSLKLLDQMNRNLVVSILDRSSVKIAHFDTILYQTYPPEAYFISVFLIF